MQKMGRKELVLQLAHPISNLPDSLARDGITLSPDGESLTYEFDTNAGRTGITALLSDIAAAGIKFRDLETRQSSLEEIFVGLVGDNK
jgi:ABC-2 type transport system ATP-binding protein